MIEFVIFETNQFIHVQPFVKKDIDNFYLI